MEIESTGPGPRMDAGFFVGHKRRMDMQRMAGYSHQRCSMIHLHPACRYVGLSNICYTIKYEII